MAQQATARPVISPRPPPAGPGTASSSAPASTEIDAAPIATQYGAVGSDAVSPARPSRTAISVDVTRYAARPAPHSTAAASQKPARRPGSGAGTGFRTEAAYTAAAMASDCRPTVARYTEPLNWLQAIGVTRLARRPGTSQASASQQASASAPRPRVATGWPSSPKSVPVTSAAATNANPVKATTGSRRSSPTTPGNTASRTAEAAASPANPSAATISSTADTTRKPASWNAVDTMPVAITMAKYPGAQRRTRLTSRPASATAAAHGQGRAGLIMPYGIRYGGRLSEPTPAGPAGSALL